MDNERAIIHNHSTLINTDSSKTSYHGAVISYGYEADIYLNDINVDISGISAEGGPGLVSEIYYQKRPSFWRMSLFFVVREGLSKSHTGIIFFCFFMRFFSKFFICENGCKLWCIQRNVK